MQTDFQDECRAILATRATVYKSDLTRLERDTSNTRRQERDHLDRWFFELFQNADDAHATEVAVLVRVVCVDNWLAPVLIQLHERFGSELKELNVEAPSDELIPNALIRAIDEFWTSARTDNPSRFLKCIMSHGLSQKSFERYLPRLGDCPVPVRREQSTTWDRASNSYFGREWGNEGLEKLFDKAEVSWVLKSRLPSRCERGLYTSMGVHSCPRVVLDDRSNIIGAEHWRASQLINDRCKITSVAPTRVDHLDIGGSSPKQISAFVSVVAENWKQYYRSHEKDVVEIVVRGNQTRRYIPAKWLSDLSDAVPLLSSGAPAPLKHCWVLDANTPALLRASLPTIDTRAFGKKSSLVKTFLRERLEVRYRVETITNLEWRNILSGIPKIVPAEKASSEASRDLVYECYEAALRHLQPDANFSGVLVLASKGNLWNYVDPSEAWIADKYDDVIGAKLWIVHISNTVYDAAVRSMGLKRLSEHVTENPVVGRAVRSSTKKYESAFVVARPYIFASALSISKDHPDAIRRSLMGISISAVEQLSKKVSLNRVQMQFTRQVDYIFQNKRLLYLRDASPHPFAALSAALAEVLRVPTLTDLFENLFRCATDGERAAKLHSRGVSYEAIDRALRYFNGRVLLSHNFNAEDEHTLPVIDPPSVSQEHSHLNLKQCDSDVVMIEQPIQYVIPYRGKRRLPRKVALDQRLTHAQRLEVEARGRQVAERRLVELGYAVRQMSSTHPGFDMLAVSGAETLRIELKCHLAECRQVTVTPKQIAESRSQDVRIIWELWNVEFLSATSRAPIRITRYRVIPEVAVSPTEYLVDLSKCEPYVRHASVR